MDWHLFRHLVLSRRAGSLVRRISMLSTAAIFVSVTAFLVVLFVMKGMNRSIEKRVLALEPHLVLELEPEASGEAREFVDQTLQREDLKTSRYESQDVILRSLDGQFQGAVARGLDTQGLREFWTEVQRLQRRQSGPVDVSLLWNPSDELGDGEVLVGIDLARSLGLFEGDLVVAVAPEGLLAAAGEAPKTERLRVKKVVATQLADLDAGLFLYGRDKSLKTWKRSPSRREGVEVRLTDGTKAAAVKKSWGEFPGLRVSTWGERNSDLFFALMLEKLVIGTFLALSGLVAGSSILTVMVLLLTQKRRDIALLRVLGLSGQKTILIFTRIGMILAGVGIGGGLVVGLLLGVYLEAYPLQVLPEHIYYDSSIPAEVDLLLTLFTLIGASVLTFLGAWIPSRQLANVAPTQILR
ncbi:MAG: ABC transporter permease [Bdellovibrionaceae bacterium]|nr:ABC transporter permease [Pseudobdellovibrionaceae bacterium]